MLFNSYEFLFLFLPITLLGIWFLTYSSSLKPKIIWVTLASLTFYGFWNPEYLFLLFFSVVINYCFGLKLSKPNSEKYILVIGVSFNLLLLGFYKYLSFAVDNISFLFNLNLETPNILLPLAISFFTFQQISYLVDTYKSKDPAKSFKEYLLYVSFFPQLIAGPIVHHKDFLPQIANSKFGTIRSSNISKAIVFFTIGLSKKILLADQFSSMANPVFDLASTQNGISFLEAWGAIICYTLQIYFDFSGYSDMAIGLGFLFGVQLPENFNSPYKAVNISDFWRRWHITLSSFLKNYLYIPLGGNRNGTTRRYVNLSLTMLLGGLWHGASWNFVIWGALHGAYLSIHHGFSKLLNKINLHIAKPISRLITLFFVMIAWVFFKLESLDESLYFLKALFGQTDFILPQYLLRLPFIKTLDIPFLDISLSFKQIMYMLAGLSIVWIAPNLGDLYFRSKYNFEKALSKHPRIVGVLLSILILWSILSMNQINEFIYYRF